jgi:predicted esterase YcpF (UPF0227 family)
MSILSISGFGSAGASPNKQRLLQLLSLQLFSKSNREIFYFTPDYTETPSETIELYDAVIQDHHDIDLIVGTSMGGWLAQHLGNKYGIPFVAINPAINPQKTLQRRIGEGTNYDDTPYSLTEEVVNAYEPMGHGGCGLILVDMDDEVIDSQETISTFSSSFQVSSFPGGNHRFTHWEESVQLIKSFYTNSELQYGLDYT